MIKWIEVMEESINMLQLGISLSVLGQQFLLYDWSF